MSERCARKNSQFNIVAPHLERGVFGVQRFAESLLGLSVGKKSAKDPYQPNDVSCEDAVGANASIPSHRRCSRSLVGSMDARRYQSPKFGFIHSHLHSIA